VPLKKFALEGNATIVYTVPRFAPAEAPLTWICIHGAGGVRTNWENQLPALEAEGWAAIAIDLPGHGEAQGEGCSRIEQYVEGVEALLDELHPARTVLCGHSMGGAIAQYIALQGRTPLAGIVLIATGAYLPLDQQLIDNCESNWELVTAAVPMAAVGPDAPDDVRQIVAERFAANDNIVAANDFRACAAFDVRDKVARITLPTCVITGSNDLITAASLGAYQGETIPNATLHALEGPGHFVMQEVPDVTNTILIDFGRSLLAG